MEQPSEAPNNLTNRFGQFSMNNEAITGVSLERIAELATQVDDPVTTDDQLHEIAKEVLVREGFTYCHYEELKKLNYAGYAHLYIFQRWDNLSLENQAKLDVYKVLFRIDHKLGTKPELQLWNCCAYAANIKIIEFFAGMDIDYEFQEERSGQTIFNVIFQECVAYLKADNWSLASLKTEKYKPLLRHVEAIFRKLAEFADFENNQEKMKRILEMTSKGGQALIIRATIYCSMEITKYLLENNININNCDSKFMTADFENAEIAKQIVDYVNPKINDHHGKSELYDRNPKNFTGSFKTTAESYPNAIHVAVTDQECPAGCLPDCNSKLIAFYYKNGLYVQRSQATQIGQGAFGTVFGGKWHGQDAVFKFIRMNLANLAGLRAASKIREDLKSRLTEINKVPDNSYILKPLGHLRQQEQTLDESTGKYVADNFEVFIFKRCKMDLEKFRNDIYKPSTDENCELLRFIMKQCFESLKALADANVSHNDIKPSNFVVDWEGTEPTITNLNWATASNFKVYLTDFGMVDRAGGTPVFCSPEGLTGTTPGVSDMFSLGRLFAFLVFEDRSLFYTLYFLPIIHQADRELIRNILLSFPILELVEKMTHNDKDERIQIQAVGDCLDSMNIEVITKATIFTELGAQGRLDLINSLENAETTDHQILQMLKETKFSFEMIDPATNTIDQLSFKFRFNTQMSKNIHEQDEASLCWVYSSSSMLRRSMKDFYNKHKDDADLDLTSTEKTEIETWLEDNALHSILRSQITMNPIPKRVLKEATGDQRNPHEAHYIKDASERMAFSTALDGPGVFNLERIQLFFKKMKLPLSKVIIKHDYFELYHPSLSDNQRFADFVRQSKLCPVIGAVNSQSGHGMVVDSAIPHGNTWYFQCKNTYKDDPLVFVGHQNLPFIQYKPEDAIIISFDRTP